VAIRFDATFDAGEFGIVEQLSPAAEIELSAFGVRRQFNRQRWHVK
jgi:hypothetical protein